MLYRIAFIFIAVFFIPVIILSQTRLDSLYNELDVADPSQKVEIFCDISEIYWQRSFDTSLLMATHALDVATEIENKSLISSALNMIGNAYFLMGDFTGGMEYYYRALTLREELGDSTSIAKSYNNIGATYINMKDYPHALEYLKKARDIFNNLDDDTYMFSILNNLGATYNELEQYDTAYEFLTDAHDFALEKNNQQDISIALTNLGEVALKMGLHDRSEKSLLEALEISKGLDDKAMMATILTNLGHLKMNKTEYGPAYKLFIESLAYSEEVNSLPDKRENYRYLSEYYEITGDNKQALSYYKLYNAASDSIMTEAGLIKIKEMEVKSNATKFNQEIQLLKMENEINHLQHLRQRILIFFLALIALLGILVFIIYFQKNRFKRESNKLLEEKNRQLQKANNKLQDSEQHLKELNSTKDKLFSIIGHDLRNPLNALLGFSELISGNPRDYTFEEIQKYSRIINDAAKNIHLLIENLLVWSRSQSGNIDFNPYEDQIYPVIDEIIKVFNIQLEKKNIKVGISVPQDTLALFDRNLLSTILRNLINNAVKFTSKGGKINISRTETDDELTVSVQDTGIGMTDEQIDQLFKLNGTSSMPGTSEEQGTGLGLILCREFVEMHGGRIWVESTPDKGSVFSFTIPRK
jgi:signal transduction histidine kinase